MAEVQYASNGKGNLGVTLGAIGTGLGALAGAGGLAGLFGVRPGGGDPDDRPVTRYDMALINDREKASVTFTKKFSGIEVADIADLTNFKITYSSDEANSTTSGTLTLTEEAKVSDTEYTWTIDNALVGETLTFTEEGYEHSDYTFMTAAADTTKDVKVVEGTTPASGEITNTYVMPGWGPVTVIPTPPTIPVSDPGTVAKKA